MSVIPTISVIVPIYNAEQYLKESINSILAQNFKDFELILINDGSQDNSLNICKEFKKIDSRVYVYDVKNGGVSAARNFGLKNANGLWVCFIDSDDLVDSNYLSNLYGDVIKGINIELVVHGIEFFDLGNNTRESKMPSGDFVYYDLDTKSKVLNNVPLICLSSPVSKLFKRSIINSNNLCFDNRISIGEDYLFVMQYIFYISKMSSNSIASYISYRRSGTLSSSYNSFEEESLAERLIFDQTIMTFCRIGYDKEEINSFYIQEYRKHAYRMLYSLYKNKVKDYNYKERVDKVRSIRLNQIKRIKLMFSQNGLNGKILAILFSKALFPLFDKLLMNLVKRKI